MATMSHPLATSPRCQTLTKNASPHLGSLAVSPSTLSLQDDCNVNTLSNTINTVIWEDDSCQAICGTGRSRMRILL
jgi:hypothetical protein